MNIVTPNQERIYRDFWEILAYLLVYLVGREKSVTYIVVTVSDMYVLKTKVSILCFCLVTGTWSEQYFDVPQHVLLG